MNFKPLILFALFLLIALICMNSCTNFDFIGDTGISEEDYFEMCPYERKSTRNFILEMPLEIIPHKKIYSVGDTITWKIETADEIFDWNRDMIFKIENFPFRPIFHLYRIESESWTSGYNHTDIFIDSVYSPRLVGGGSTFANSLRGGFTYAEGIYKFEFQTVMREPGVYINYVVDSVIFFNRDEFVPLPPEEYRDVVNSSGCPEIEYDIAYTLQGDPHYRVFSEEMMFLDNEVYFGEMGQFGNENSDLWGRGAGIIVERRGVFGFEVVE